MKSTLNALTTVILIAFDTPVAIAQTDAKGKSDEQKDQSQLSLTQRANIAFAVGCIAWLDSGCIETALPHVKK